MHKNQHYTLGPIHFIIIYDSITQVKRNCSLLTIRQDRKILIISNGLILP